MSSYIAGKKRPKDVFSSQIHWFFSNRDKRRIQECYSSSFFFFNMKENLAPAVMHMHEDTTVMNESVFKNGIITLYAVERKKKEKLIKAQSKKQKKPLLRLFMHMETVTFQCKVSDS